MVNYMPKQDNIRVGVVFGGRSSEHEVSLSSAQNVMNALREAGYAVAPIGITPAGRWLTGDQVEQLTASPWRIGGRISRRRSSRQTTPVATDTWAMLPHGSASGPICRRSMWCFQFSHGPYGEDGTIQGLLEMANIPYVGCGVLSSAAAMDKAVAKKLFDAAGLPQTPSLLVLRPEWNKDASHESSARSKRNLPIRSSSSPPTWAAASE